MALRSKGDRESQVNPSAPVAGSSADGAEVDKLLMHARRFADAVGISGVIQPEPQSPAGLRIATLADGDAEDPARHRAWYLLAALLGELESNAAPSNAAAPAFLQWLVNPDDPSATAFWELLACARRSAGLRRQPGAASDAPSASEAA